MEVKKYIKGFNDGYLLKQHKPKLLENILSTSSSNKYIEGLRDGERTYSQEKTRTRTQELKSFKPKNRDLGLER